MINAEKKKILIKTSWLSFFIFINKPIGFLRDILQNRYLGIGAISDAYVIAWRIPNIFRRIFGEGLLNSVLLPYLVEIKKNHHKKLIEEVITAVSIMLQTIVMGICFLIACYSDCIINFLSPGNPLRAVIAGPLLSILIFFTFFMTWSAVLGIPLQLKNNFYTGPQSQFLVNIALCVEFFCAWKYSWNIATMMYWTTANGIIILLFYYFIYRQYDYSFCFPSTIAVWYAIDFFKKFFLALVSSLLLESNALFSLSFSSYLQVGIVSINEILLTLIRVPQQIFGSALSSVSSVDLTTYVMSKSEQLTEYLSNINSLLFYASIITSIGIFIFGKIFFTIFFYFSNITDNPYIMHADYYLFILSLTLYPAIISKIMANIIYAYKNVTSVTIISFITICIQNIVLYFTIGNYQLDACILSYLIGDIIRFFLLLIFLKWQYNINLYQGISKQDCYRYGKFILYSTVIIVNIYITLKNYLPLNFLFRQECIKLLSLFPIIFMMKKILKK